MLSLSPIWVLTHWGRVTHICVSKLTIIGSDNGLSLVAPSHYLNQCWNIVNWTLRNKLQWNLNRNSNIFIQENAFESVVCETVAILSLPQCVKKQYPGGVSLHLVSSSNEFSWHLIFWGKNNTRPVQFVLEFKCNHLICHTNNTSNLSTCMHHL